MMNKPQYKSDEPKQLEVCKEVIKDLFKIIDETGIDGNFEHLYFEIRMKLINNGLQELRSELWENGST